MLSKTRITSIKRLHQKKYRLELKQFVVEGIKSVEEFLKSEFETSDFFHTADYQISTEIKQTLIKKKICVTLITAAEMKAISQMISPSPCFIIVHQRAYISNEVVLKHAENTLVLALDAINDPGNLGTIIRVCDWFDIRYVMLGEGSVELYNPKTIQASMGSLTRVQVSTADLKTVLQQFKGYCMGALLGGENLYDQSLPRAGILVLGNEANGIQHHLIDCIHHKIEIPRFGHAESLNVGIACAIFLNHYRFKPN